MRLASRVRTCRGTPRRSSKSSTGQGTHAISSRIAAGAYPLPALKTTPVSAAGTVTTSETTAPPV